MCVARCRAVALMRGARSFGLPSAPKPSSSLISANSGSTLSTVVSGLSLPRSIRIIAAVLPTALVIEKMRNTVSSAAGLPGAALAGGARPGDAVGVGRHGDGKGQVLAGDGLVDDTIQF